MNENIQQPEVSSAIAAIANTVREARTRLGLTVEQLAQRSSVSAGALSQLERGMGNPSLSTLARIATALSVPLTELISSRSVRSTGLVRDQERIQLEALDAASAEAGLVRTLLTPSLSALLQVIETVLPAGFSNSDRPFRRIGMECVVVSSGKVRIHVGDDAFDLSAGDALTYDCTRPHWWENIGSEPAVVLGVATPMGP